ncbi:hypothetical protein VUJ49_06640 [Pseudomonas berkeleyensis]|uniref:Uncharacterized protein n=1 Tax=Pseudomonas berkeleyensis TaxID=2726956 RepID=A0A7G5DSK3_9PSED|nr:hypothetical protein [Pseudomonas berkeleyensis]QMV64728.1 hypothetical protein HS968_06615 [Pseudomonas berkeleyensis]WSO40196.1 hypothetical protein VUJ49_06640 [Pseudomonas berkeleyensis]
MRPLILLNQLTIVLLYLAALLFVGGVTLALFISPSHVPLALVAALLTLIFTIPISLFCLVSACRKGCISHSYVVFSVLISCFIAGLGWAVIPFVLRRDLADHLSGSAVTEEVG